MKNTIETQKRTEVETIVRNSIANLVVPRKINEINDSDKLDEDLGIRGIDRGAMLSVIRAKFGIDFMLGESKKIITFGDLVAAVCRYQ